MTKLGAMETLFLCVIKLFHFVELFCNNNIHKIPHKFCICILTDMNSRILVIFFELFHVHYLF